MDYQPRAEGVRLAAAAAYLPLVAIVLLVQRKHRDVRLVRFHAYQALGLAAILIALVLVGSIASTLFGTMPGLGFLINLAIGAYFLVVLVGATAVGFYAAYMAFQGNYTSFPILTDWVWQKVNGPAPVAVPPVPGLPGEPGEEEPRRRKRRRPAPEEDASP